MPRKASIYGDVLAQWESMLTAMAGKTGEFPFLQAGIEKLQDHLDRAKQQVVLHEEAEAQRQAASRELLGLVGEGKKVATFLRVGLKQVFGNASVKLIEFGIQPFRRRTRSSTGPEPAGPQPEPTVPSSPVPPAEPAE